MRKENWHDRNNRNCKLTDWHSSECTGEYYDRRKHSEMVQEEITNKTQTNNKEDKRT